MFVHHARRFGSRRPGCVDLQEIAGRGVCDERAELVVRGGVAGRRALAGNRTSDLLPHQEAAIRDAQVPHGAGLSEDSQDGSRSTRAGLRLSAI